MNDARKRGQIRECDETLGVSALEIESDVRQRDVKNRNERSGVERSVVQGKSRTLLIRDWPLRPLAC